MIGALMKTNRLDQQLEHHHGRNPGCTFVPSIRNYGVPIQWSADVTEWAHISEIKLSSPTMVLLCCYNHSAFIARLTLVDFVCLLDLH